MSRLPIRFAPKVPADDDRTREVCDHCGFVDYRNPRIVVGSVATWDGLILMCRRAIEPRIGFWTLPAGYLEVGETPAEGAAREAWEEARADLAIRDLFAIYTIRRISQVQLIYRAHLRRPDVTPGPESQEVRLFSPDDLPAPETIAFPSVRWALAQFREAGDAEVLAPRVNPAGADERIAG